MNCLTVVTLLVAGLCAAVGGTRPSRPCACNRLYFPVCGHDGQDYDNPNCAKRCGHVGYRVGTCDSLQPCACPFSIQPVCARTPDGTVKSFDNECQATCENSATIINQGECAAGIEQPIYRPGGQKSHQAISTGVREKKQHASRCVCTQEFVPVCGLVAGKWTTFGNQCAAKCAGAERSKPGACGTGGGCACTRIYKPVCGSLDGTLKTYPSQCVADCQEAVTVSDGVCAAAPDNSLPGKAKKSADDGLPCICTQEYVPVCGFKNGRWTDYSNGCNARCNNAEPILNRPCIAPVQLPVFPDDKVAAQLPVVSDTGDDKYPAQLPVFPDDKYPAQLPVFPGDSDDSDDSDEPDEDLVASQLPSFPRILQKIFQ